MTVHPETSSAFGLPLGINCFKRSLLLVRKPQTACDRAGPCAAQVRRRHRELSTALLRVMRRVDLLEGRFAAANGYWSGQQQRGAAADLARQLVALEASIAPGASGLFVPTRNLALQPKLTALRASCATVAPACVHAKQGAPMTHGQASYNFALHALELRQPRCFKMCPSAILDHAPIPCRTRLTAMRSPPLPVPAAARFLVLAAAR